jgi:NAD-dependent deacetylase
MNPAEALARELKQASRIVVFTGAGISTESGIPDFRSPGGVWSRMKPIYFQEFVGSEAKRREAWGRVFSGAAGWVGKQPNAGHHAVARLIHAGKASSVITQNVDNLLVDLGEIPVCRECGELVKTATISFGQQMPEEPMMRAEEETFSCDLFLVLGSSLVVTPAALFPVKAKRMGARLAILNREETPLDDIADLVLNEEIGPTMTAAMRDLN